MSAETDDLARAIEKVLVAQRAGIVTGWLLGSNVDGGVLRGYALRLRLRDGRDLTSHGVTPTAAVDAMILQLAR